MPNPATMEGPKRKPVTLWILRAVVSSSLVIGLLLWLPINDVWLAAKRVPFHLWCILLIGFLSGHVLSAWKWWYLIDVKNIRYLNAVRAHFAGLSANLCLPGMAGGDVVRAAIVIRDSQKKTQLAIRSLADRIIDCIALLLIALASGIFIEAIQFDPLSLILFTGIVLVAGVAGVSCGLWLLSRKQTGIARSTFDALIQLGQCPGRVLTCLILSLLIQSCFIYLNVALGSAAGVEVPTIAWFFAWPLAKLVAVLPISLAGLGVREASLASLLLNFGAVPATVVATGFVWQSIIIAAGVSSACILSLTSSLPTRPTSSSPETTQAPTNSVANVDLTKNPMDTSDA